MRKAEPWKKTLYVVFTTQLVSVIGFATIFPFLPLYVESLGTQTRFGVEFLSGMVFSAQAFTMMVAAPIWGAIADRYGRKAMIGRAMFGGAITVFLMGFAQSAEMLILLRAIQGIVAGTISAANALVAATVPRARIGFAMGLMQVALWGGVAVGPLIGGVLADAFGYRASFVLTAGLLFAAGILSWIGISENFVPAIKSRASKLAFLADWRAILTAPGVAMIYSLRFSVGLGQMLIFPVLPLLVFSLLPASAAVNTYTGLITGIGGGASTASVIYFGKLGDRIGHNRILKGSALLTGLFYLPQAAVTAAWQLLLLQALTGAAMGALLTSLTALLAQTTRAGEEGSVYGLDNAVVASSRVVAPLIGAGVAAWIGLRATFLFTSALFLAIALTASLKFTRQVQVAANPVAAERPGIG